MKKTIALLLSVFLLLTLFSGCDNTKQPQVDATTTQADTTANNPPVAIFEADVWDGSIATSFASGEGTESAPYLITKASQLAFLAQEINSGKDYANKYFSLACDLDLNHIEWTPIGNGTYSFSAHFEGNGHTISNLKISEGIAYHQVYSGEIICEWGIAGLFGFCENITILNLNIENADISTDIKANYLVAGILAAHITPTSNASIQNIKISNSTIKAYTTTSTTVTERFNNNAYIGGIVGELSFPLDGRTPVMKMDQLYSEVSIDCESTYYYVHRIGGIAGKAKNLNVFECSNFASYLTAYLPLNYGKNLAGAFGTIYNGANCQIKLSNSFSETRINHRPIMLNEGYYYTSHALIGHFEQYFNISGEMGNTKVALENLFGCVKPTDDKAGFSGPIYELFKIGTPLDEAEMFPQTNCHGCETLPENHGLDPSIWDLTAPGRPKLK